jgi:hypothetical protein
MSIEKICEVTNRSGSNVFYSIDEDNLRREFTPGETKRIPYAELEKLSYRPGGRAILAEYLMVKNVEALNELDMQVEQEYNMDANAVKEMLINGSLDQLLDALDFAPGGVIELIKDIALALPLNDMQKREAIYKATGFNVDAAIRNIQLEKQAAAEEGQVEETTGKQRRVKSEEKPAGRRTTPQYKVVNEE